MRQVFLDTETTGLHADLGDRIIEIGCLELIDRQPTGRTLHRYINPERPSHADALDVHGLTDAFLADKPNFAEVAPELLDFLDGAEIVIHNAAFDIGFLDAELARAGLACVAIRAGRIVDSLELARTLYPGKANSLDSLCKRHEIDDSARTSHGALLDARLLSEVYIVMTRRQAALALAGTQVTAMAAADIEVDLARYPTQVVEPTAEELRVHQAMLEEMAAQTKVRPTWLSAALSAADETSVTRKGHP